MEKLIEKFCAIGLREALGRLNVICPGGKAEDHVDALRLMQKYHPHDIELWKNIPEGPSNFKKSDDDTQFNCFMFCLDLQYGDIRDMIGTDGRRIPNSDYMSLLCKNYMTEKDSESANNGDFILYFSDGKIVHAGKVESGKVISKWGSDHIWIHGIFEVPLLYGNEVKFYNKIEKDLCVKAFWEWIQEHQV